MINLLPARQKSKIDQERRWKVILILAVLFVLFLVFFSGFVYSARILAMNLLEKEIALLEGEEAEFADIARKEEKVREFNSAVSEIALFYKRSADLSDVFMKIGEVLPSGSRLDTFQLSKRTDPVSQKKINQLILQGYSPDWQSLVEMEGRMKELFPVVEFSPGTWTQVEDINFFVSIEIE